MPQTWIKENVFMYNNTFVYNNAAIKYFYYFLWRKGPRKTKVLRAHENQNVAQSKVLRAHENQNKTQNVAYFLL